MSRVVLTKKMLEIISTGIDDRRIIIGDDLSLDNVINKKELEKELEICEKVDDWVFAIKKKRGYIWEVKFTMTLCMRSIKTKTKE